jgi:type II secretory ATPase GspE/PulE/Tfp pilus assembly ATPase PilB-like protein
VTQKSIVQEGHFSNKVPGRRVDYRVSLAPSVFGQKLVIRVQDTALAPVRISDLNLPQWMLKEVEETMQQDQGMVLVCGPTGSGKTTTLYSLIRSSDTSSRNFVTIEDPVEIQIEGVTQLPVDEVEGKSFSALLRSVLRQDPDAILVGEIRDPETARIAMQAAITGHLVFSTVHTTSTIGTIFRLLDLGVEPYLIAQGLHLVLAQRLVRQLCPYCKKAVKPTAEQLAKMPNNGQGVKQTFIPVGCKRCLSTGFSGRRAFFELLRTTEELRETIVRSPTMGELSKALANTRFEKLQQTGYQLVADGSVSYEEIDRAVGR